MESIGEKSEGLGTQFRNEEADAPNISTFPNSTPLGSFGYFYGIPLLPSIGQVLERDDLYMFLSTQTCGRLTKTWICERIIYCLESMISDITNVLLNTYRRG